MIDIKSFKSSPKFPTINTEIKHSFNLSGNVFEFNCPAVNLGFELSGLKLIKSPINIYDKSDYFLEKNSLSYLMFFRTGWDIPYSIFSREKLGTYELTFNVVKANISENLFSVTQWERATQIIINNKGTSLTKGLKNIKSWGEAIYNDTRWLKILINNVYDIPHRVIFTTPISENHLIQLNFEAPKSSSIEEKGIDLTPYFNDSVNQVLSTSRLSLAEGSKNDSIKYNKENFSQSALDMDWEFLRK